MSFVSYAQNFEDVLLWRALKGVSSGRYLDIGAQDPVTDSVSLAFYEAGWRGVHVEPTPYFAARLREARPDEVVVEAAVSDRGGLIDFFEIVNTGLSTGRADIAERHIKRGYAARQISVPTVRLDQLLDKWAAVHWMKIDVEGMESSVLASWGESSARPWIVVVEATIPLEQVPTDAPWRAELTTRGYQEAYFDGLSRYFVHEAQKELAGNFASPPNVFDCYQVTERHFSASRLVELAANEREASSNRLGQLAVERSELAERLSAETEALRKVSVHRDSLATELKRSEEDLRRAEQSRSAADTLAQQLADELATAQRAYESLTQRLTDAEAEHRRSAQAMWIAHRTREEQLVTGAAATEAELRGGISELELRAREREVAIRALEVRLADAESLIFRAIAVPPDRWQKLGRALRLSRLDRVRAMLHSWQIQARGCDPIQLSEQRMPTVSAQEPLPDLQASSLAEILSLEGRDFVRSAYANVLGREADPEGEAYYAHRLAGGHSKVEILHQMRRSPEARLFPDTVFGLNDALRTYQFNALWLGKKKAGELVANRIVRASNTPHVDYFMHYYDEDFVRAAYLFYLGREPEPAGLQHHARRLREGVSRQQILVDIARSEEARSRNRHAAGERAVATSLAIERIPLIGTFVIILKFHSRLRSHLRDIRALQNHLYRISRKVA